MVQYGLKWMLFHLDAAGTSKDERLKRVGNFIAALSTARKIMRLSNFLDPLSRLIGELPRSSIPTHLCADLCVPMSV